MATSISVAKAFNANGFVSIDLMNEEDIYTHFMEARFVADHGDKISFDCNSLTSDVATDFYTLEGECGGEDITITFETKQDAEDFINLYA